MPATLSRCTELMSGPTVVSGLEAVPHHFSLGRGGRRLVEPLDCVRVDEEALGCDAHLAAVAVLALDSGCGDGFDVGIGEDEHRGIAAELQREPW